MTAVDTLTTVQHARIIGSDAEALAVARALSEELASGDVARDANRELPFAQMDRIAQSGLLAITVPKSHGGADVSMQTLGQVIALLSAGDASVGQIPQNHFYFVGILIEQATERQLEFFSRELLLGRQFGNAIAERRTKAVNQYDIEFTRSDDGEYVLHGSKYYATGSPFAHWIPTYANDDLGRLHAAFVPAGSPGLTVDDDWAGMGQRTTGSGTVRFDQVRVSPEHVVPVYPLFERTEVFGAFGNFMHAAIDVGIAVAALRDGKRLVRELARPWWEAGVENAGEEAGVIDRFGELAVITRAARALLNEAADALEVARADLTESTSAEASAAVAAARAMADRAALTVSTEVFELIGSRAASDELNLHRHWRNARTHTLHDPRRWKVRHLGNWELNDVPPPGNRIG